MKQEEIKWEANHNKLLSELKYLVYLILTDKKEVEGAFLDESRKAFKKEVPLFSALSPTLTRLQKKIPGSFKSHKLAGVNNSIFLMVSSNQHSS